MSTPPVAMQAALEMGIKTMQWGHYASSYDGVIAGHVARVLTGGNLSLPNGSLKNTS